jgi:lipopolysaccharide export system permease protein
MKRVLGSYLRRRVAGQIIGLLLALTGLMQLVELLEVTPEVLDRKLGVAGLLHYAVLRIPGELVFALPLAGLLGSMSAFHAMARSREITALRTAGVGLKRVLLYLLPVPFLFALLHVALSQLVVPPVEASLKAWWDSATPLESKPADPQWVRTSNGILMFERNSADGARLLDVRIYDRDPQGLLNIRTRASGADWDGSQWQLSNVKDMQVVPGMAAGSVAQRAWRPKDLRPGVVMDLDSKDPHMSSMDLIEVISGERASTLQRSVIQTVLLQSFVAPFTVFIMMLLAMPAAIVSERGGGGGRVLLALALGLGFVLVNGILSAFGTSGRISPLMAATAAPVLFAILGAWQLRSCERTS